LRCYKDQVIAITGAGSGIGRELALLLGGRGARLVLLGRRRQRLEALREEMASRNAGTVVLVTPCDVADTAQVEAWVASVLEQVEGIDVLINNAGRGAYGPFHAVSLKDHSAVVDTNLGGVIHTTHAVLPSMLKRGCGQLVFVSSVVGGLPAPEHAVYGATKAAVHAFAESLAHELDGQGIGVTVVAPGLVRSEFSEISQTPLHRFARLPSKSSPDAAQAVLRAMERDRSLVITDPLSVLATSLRRHAPRCFAWLYRRGFRRLRRTSD
jgi:short-subunit dehydrogenase